VKSYVVAITGASGSVYGLKLVEQLLAAGNAVTLTVTDAGREVMRSEAGFALPGVGPAAADALERFLELAPTGSLRVVAPGGRPDAAEPDLASVEGMVACPASMGFCGSVAAGLASGFPERVADLMLKEHRPLVLVPRDAPLSVVHLRNLTSLAEAGAVIVPASPAFSPRPASIDDLVDFVVGKVLDQLSVEHRLFGGRGEQRGA
jgi:flavin prenyltransferase